MPATSALVSPSAVLCSASSAWSCSTCSRELAASAAAAGERLLSLRQLGRQAWDFGSGLAERSPLLRELGLELLDLLA